MAFFIKKTTNRPENCKIISDYNQKPLTVLFLLKADYSFVLCDQTIDRLIASLAWESSKTAFEYNEKYSRNCAIVKSIPIVKTFRSIAMCSNQMNHIQWCTNFNYSYIWEIGTKIKRKNFFFFVKYFIFDEISKMVAIHLLYIYI